MFISQDDHAALKSLLFEAWNEGALVPVEPFTMGIQKSSTHQRYKIVQADKNIDYRIELHTDDEVYLVPIE